MLYSIVLLLERTELLIQMRMLRKKERQIRGFLLLLIKSESQFKLIQWAVIKQKRNLRTYEFPLIFLNFEEKLFIYLLSNFTRDQKVRSKKFFHHVLIFVSYHSSFQSGEKLLTDLIFCLFQFRFQVHSKMKLEANKPVSMVKRMCETLVFQTLSQLF